MSKCSELRKRIYLGRLCVGKCNPTQSHVKIIRTHENALFSLRACPREKRRLPEILRSTTSYVELFLSLIVVF